MTTTLECDREFAHFLEWTRRDAVEAERWQTDAATARIQAYDLETERYRRALHRPIRYRFTDQQLAIAKAVDAAQARSTAA